TEARCVASCTCGVHGCYGVPPVGFTGSDKSRLSEICKFRYIVARGLIRHHAPRPCRGARLLPHDADAIPAGGGSNIDLGVAIVRIAPAPAFEQTVRSSDPTESDATGQIAARIDNAAPALAHVQSFSAGVFTGRRTSARPNAAHKQHARAVVLFQVIDIGLETCGVSDANASTRTSLGRYDDASSVAVG